MINKILLITISSLSLLGCSTLVGNENSSDDSVKTMTQCEQLQALIKSHEDGFKEVRKTRSNSKLADIWTSKYHLIGNNCQIFGWGKGKFSYSCSITSPSEAVAMEKYQNAKSKIEACIGESWALNERPRHGKKGSVAIYTAEEHQTAVATHVFETSGIFKDEWTNYVFVGDSKRIK